MAYQTIPPSNGGSQDSATAAWASMVAAFVATKDATITKAKLVASNADLSPYDRPAVGGSGSGYLYQPAGYAGAFALRLDTGTTGSSSVVVRNKSQPVPAGASTYDNLIANARTSHWAQASQVIINSVNATCDIYPLAMSDEAAASTVFGVIGATSQTLFTLKVGTAAAVGSLSAVGTLGVTVNTLITVCDGTTVSAYVNFATTAVASGPSNTGPNAAAHAIFYAGNGATTTNSSMTILRHVTMSA